MHEPETDTTIINQASALLSASPCLIAGLSNLASLVYDALPDLNWAGFYLMHEGELVVGPFCGKPACIRIPVSKGVCGAAVREQSVQRIADVSQFPGHIACDSRSRSEIVIPVRREGRIVGVLDIDSPVLDRFSEKDEKLLKTVVSLLESSPVWQTPSYSFG